MITNWEALYVRMALARALYLKYAVLTIRLNTLAQLVIRYGHG